MSFLIGLGTIRLSTRHRVGLDLSEMFPRSSEFQKMLYQGAMAGKRPQSLHTGKSIHTVTICKGEPVRGDRIRRVLPLKGGMLGHRA